MDDLHHQLGRPPHAAGAHIRSCLTTAAPSMLEQLIEFCGRVTSDDCEPALVEVMTALQLDALAARWELDDQLGRMLGGI